MYNNTYNIINIATEILEILMKQDILINALSKRTLDLIEHNLRDIEIQEYRDKLLTAIKLFKDYHYEKYKNVDFNTIKIINSLIIFLSDPIKFLQKINYNKINIYDKTNSKLKYYLLKLGLATIDQELTEYEANQQHKRIIRSASNRLVF